MKKVIFSLALGTFGLGMAEFGIMGVLTELARDVGITIPTAGHMISFYAFGVVLGAPVMALFSSRFSLKHILLFLVTLCVMGNAIFTFSSSYLMLAVGRLVSGFPHGAFFGVGAIVLSKIIRPGKVTAAVAGMVSGMTVANLVGIPVGTYLSQEFSWRYTFLLIAVLTSPCSPQFSSGCRISVTKPKAACANSFTSCVAPRRGSFSPPRCSAMRAFLPGSAISSHL